MGSELLLFSFLDEREVSSCKGKFFVSIGLINFFGTILNWSDLLRVSGFFKITLGFGGSFMSLLDIDGFTSVSFFTGGFISNLILFIHR